MYECVYLSNWYIKSTVYKRSLYSFKLSKNWSSEQLKSFLYYTSILNSSFNLSHDWLFDRAPVSTGAVLYSNVGLSLVVLWTKKRYSSFLWKALVFQKLCFKDNYIENVQNPQWLWHKIIPVSLKWRAILKMPSTAF